VKTGRIALLTAVMIIAAISGTWFMLSPSLEKQAALDVQNRLLADMETYIADRTAAEPETAAPELISAPVNVPLPQTGEGIGILEIDKISLKLPVVEGVTEDCLKTAVGRVPETAFIGETGNAVIAGHRSYTYGEYFNRLGEMETGDIIIYTPKDGESMTFEVFEVTEITPGDQIAFIQPEDESIITLYTCTPVRTATHRLLVRAIKI